MKDWNLQGRVISVMYFILVYLLHVLHLPLTLTEGEVAHVSKIDPVDYETFCQHKFSLNCPVVGQFSWECAKALTDCTSQDYPYHCIMNTDGKVFHVCAAAQICPKGTGAIYDPSKDAVICQKCPAGHYQPLNIWSNNTAVCKRKFDCDNIVAHKIECPVDSDKENTQDTLCRCDARNGYIYSDLETTDMCFLGNSERCFKADCAAGHERLLNYTCAPICEEGFKRYENDECVPINTDIPMTSGVTEKVSPTSTVSSENSSKGNSSGAIDTDKIVIATIVTAIISLLIILIVVVCWKCKLYKKCLMATNSRRSPRRQSSRDQSDETEMRQLNEVTVDRPNQVPAFVPEQVTTNDVATVVPEQVTTNDGTNPIQHNYYINATNVTVGPNSSIICHGAIPIQQQTTDDSPIRHINPHQADSIPPLTNS